MGNLFNPSDAGEAERPIAGAFPFCDTKFKKIKIAKSDKTLHIYLP